MSPKPLCVQINWQTSFGGGELYTRFFSAALVALGWEVKLIAARDAAFWKDLAMPGVEIIPIASGRDIPGVLPQGQALVVTHTTLPEDLAREVAARHRLGGFVHMPLNERDPAGLAHYHRIFCVSDYVARTARERGHDQVHGEAMLGVADLRPRSGVASPLQRRSEYDWDKRKFRDRAMSWCEPLFQRSGIAFERRPGLTLGIVSRLTPIKQFPLLFSLLAPALAEQPGVNLEIFGSGGYASVRDLRAALAPLGERARWWGHQSDPAAIYPQLDYLLSGLPEREALGLNLIEAQVAGTPVLAVAAPPFTETVLDGSSGFLYRDPRADGAEDFRRLLGDLAAGRPRPDPRLAKSHLARFSAAAFQARVERAMAALAA
jgi:glycosyltransferase involved in cell wall biosynthesis